MGRTYTKLSREVASGGVAKLPKVGGGTENCLPNLYLYISLRHRIVVDFHMCF